MSGIETFLQELEAMQLVRHAGKVVAVDPVLITITGLAPYAVLGDIVAIAPKNAGPAIKGEIVSISKNTMKIMPFSQISRIGVGEHAWLEKEQPLRPCDDWKGRIIDAFGLPLDGKPLAHGLRDAALHKAPPPPVTRGAMGPRFETGMAVFDSLLPLARGQRIGLFAGAGVGKSTLLAQFARQTDADFIVLALIGERGRELRDFVEKALGPEGMARSIIIAATADQPPLVKCRAALTAMAVAEYFRDQGQHGLLLFDSLTRFAEAHREAALAIGETPSLRAFPPSTVSRLANLLERAGPGDAPAGVSPGSISAVFSVLVAGSDMEEPVADMVRGLLDGHIILDREIAERGRFPAVDLVRSVSRALPEVASPQQNALITHARALTARYNQIEPMVQAGLYQPGQDRLADEARAKFDGLERFMAASSTGIDDCFEQLETILKQLPMANETIA